MKQPITMTKHQLANALFATTLSGGAIRINLTVFTGISSIERESGNGHTFNVKGYGIDGKEHTVFVQTID